VHQVGEHLPLLLHGAGRQDQPRHPRAHLERREQGTDLKYPSVSAVYPHRCPRSGRPDLLLKQGP
jgi:hypothetical protein